MSLILLQFEAEIENKAADDVFLIKKVSSAFAAL
jgi:hypothetical protein